MELCSYSKTSIYYVDDPMVSVDDHQGKRLEFIAESITAIT